MATILPDGTPPTTVAAMHFAEGVGAEVTQPDAGLRDGNGFEYDQKPEHYNFNWTFQMLGRWISYIVDRFTQIFTVLTNHDDRIVTNEGDIGTIETRVTATEGDFDFLQNRSHAASAHGYGWEPFSLIASPTLYISPGRKVFDRDFEVYVNVGVASTDLIQPQKSMNAAWQLGLGGQGAVPAAIYPLTGVNTVHVFLLLNTTTGVADIAIDTDGHGVNIGNDTNVIAAGMSGTRKYLCSCMLSESGGINTIRPFATYGDEVMVAYTAVSVSYASASGFASLLGMPHGLAVCEVEITVAGTETNSVTVLAGIVGGGVTVTPGQSKIARLACSGGDIAYSASGTTGAFSIRVLSYRIPAELNRFPA